MAETEIPSDRDKVVIFLLKPFVAHFYHYSTYALTQSNGKHYI